MPLLLVVIFAFITVSRPQDHLAAWLFVPYAARVAFALVLNTSIFTLKLFQLRRDKTQERSILGNFDLLSARLLGFWNGKS